MTDPVPAPGFVEQPMPAIPIGPGQGPSYRYVGAQARTRGDGESLGDIGWMDEHGCLHLADRRTDMILVGGSNVYPAEVEAALDEHPQVASSAVIGLPDPDLGQVVHAIVQQQPRSFELVREPLRDDAGKVRRTTQLLADRVPARQ